jgi:hypothetical protein
MNGSEIKEQLSDIIDEAKMPDGSCSWVAFWDLVNLVKEITKQIN